jgi:hypothetical protein
VSYEGTREAVKQILQPELDGGGEHSCDDARSNKLVELTTFFSMFAGYRPWFYNQTGASIDILEQKSVLFGTNLVAQDGKSALCVKCAGLKDFILTTLMVC